jgi:hypothetical protein
MATKTAVWFGLGCDLENQQVAVMGFADSEALCDRKNHDPSRLLEAGPGFKELKSFQLDDDTGRNVNTWLLSFGIPEAARAEIIQQIGKEFTCMVRDQE